MLERRQLKCSCHIRKTHAFFSEIIDILSNRRNIRLSLNNNNNNLFGKNDG